MLGLQELYLFEHMHHGFFQLHPSSCFRFQSILQWLDKGGSLLDLMFIGLAHADFLFETIVKDVLLLIHQDGHIFHSLFESFTHGSFFVQLLFQVLNATSPLLLLLLEVSPSGVSLVSRGVATIVFFIFQRQEHRGRFDLGAQRELSIEVFIIIAFITSKIGQRGRASVLLSPLMSLAQLVDFDENDMLLLVLVRVQVIAGHTVAVFVVIVIVLIQDRFGFTNDNGKVDT